MIFTLPISKNYVSHWGIWEAVREILQNAYDQRDADPDCIVTSDWCNGVLSIRTSTGKLLRSSLVLGESAKADGARGKFGEGYKLALLVLLRDGYHVSIHNCDQVWEPKLVDSEEWGTTVLQIEVADAAFPQTGVEYRIGMPEETWEYCRNRIDVAYDDENRIIEDQPGVVYVGGLYVTTLADFKKGYSFTPSEVPLDRDRGMVKNFDIKYAASKLHARSGTDAYQLLKDKAPDVDFFESHYVKGSILESYEAEHGDAIPVADQRDVEQAVKAGVKWTLVPAGLLAVLKRFKTWIIPTTETPAVRLHKFYTRYMWSLSDDARTELDSIIKALEGNHVSEAH